MSADYRMDIRVAIIAAFRHGYQQGHVDARAGSGSAEEDAAADYLLNLPPLARQLVGPPMSAP